MLREDPREGIMKVSEPGNAIYLEMGVWYDKKRDQIHLTAKGVHGFHSTVNNDPASKRGHPNLFRKLARALKEAGSPHPEAK
jgi:hypothetical protein